ncbi:glycerophosphoryl diester phosphodiesterase membrane domain-containing protein [Lactococcus termiticola]|uniref:Glycerophosphodiester phosphodiesterase n=1 Tax=Lactococcus termiticola TaxID=2169526 RepID=A0A2R5HKB5_9LACT|nr:glycerophosphodiester phosphodiesterase [Lactococcus termiticola]GBG97228.1 glycerophosphodiester phosphodiesterase [Lactococcus termiticola]
MFSFFKSYAKEFRKNWLAYMSLFLGVYFSITYIIVPIFHALAAWLMRLGGIPYISFNNLGSIIGQHLLGFIALIILLLVIIFLVYVQFVFQMVGVLMIQKGEGSFRKIFHETAVRLKLVSFRTLLFFLLYFVIILPFGSYVFSSPLLAKVKIPVFTLEFFLAKWQNSLLLLAIMAVILFIGYRLLLTLPLTIVEKQPVREALKESWKRTGAWRTFWRYVFSIGVIWIVVYAVTDLINYGLWGLQILADKAPNGFALTTAIIFMTIMELLAQLSSIFVSIMLFSFLLKELGHEPVANANSKMSLKRGGIILLSLIALLFVGSNTYYMLGATDKKNIQTISHRGVDEENGVQNTIPAMLATNKHKPDYVEMDIQESKDHQFVVMHDANLKALTGVDKKPQDMTLAELKKLTAHENGKSAPVASFDDYFKSAQEVHQKLLIEIKTTPYDSSDLVKIFNAKYGEAIIKNGDMIHSLDYKVIEKLHKLNPKLTVSFILPFNAIFPQTVANAYTMEATTLDSSFVNTAHGQNKKVFAWTVNEPGVMEEMMFNGVDGIITDNLDKLKSQLITYEMHPTYANRLRLLFSLSPSLGDSVGD